MFSSNLQIDSPEIVLQKHIFWVPEGDPVLNFGNSGALCESHTVMLDYDTAAIDSRHRAAKRVLTACQNPPASARISFQTDT